MQNWVQPMTTWTGTAIGPKSSYAQTRCSCVAQTSGAGGADSSSNDFSRPKWRRFSPVHRVDMERWTGELRVAREWGRRWESGCRRVSSGGARWRPAWGTERGEVAQTGVKAWWGAAVSGYLWKEEEEGELRRRPMRRGVTAAWRLPTKTEMGWGQLSPTLTSHGWRPDGWHCQTSGPGVGLSATDRCYPAADPIRFKTYLKQK
jgi:hypothetical protein